MTQAQFATPDGRWGTGRWQEQVIFDTYTNLPTWWYPFYLINPKHKHLRMWGLDSASKSVTFKNKTNWKSSRCERLKYKESFKGCVAAKVEHFIGIFLKRFTSVTDGAALMARVASISVSREIHAADEIWMRCTAHFLSNSMITVIR